jgi:hypothetical protein
VPLVCIIIKGRNGTFVADFPVMNNVSTVAYTARKAQTAAPGSKALNYWNFSEIIEASSSAA